MTTRRQINAGLRRHRLYLAGAVFAGVSAAGPAGAQTCAAHDVIAAILSERHGESVVGRGLQSAKRALEVWASESGSWSAVIVRADGTACLVASGQAWSPVEPPAEGEPG